jgi:predicted transcriptional regulator
VTDKIIELTSEIAASYLGANAVSMDDLPSLIKSIHAALSTVGQTLVDPEIDAKPTAAQIRKSITPDALISFIDGKPYRMLKRHLTTHGETIASYKARFGLPADYPTTAPTYSAARSAMAKSLGLGNSRKGKTADAPVTAQRKVGRPKKVAE